MSLLDAFIAFPFREFTNMKLGLERVRSALRAIGNPQDSFPSVLIAGTNGKGSVARILESVLLASGYPVGLYTSPHLERFTERIRRGGEEVEPSCLEEILSEWNRAGILSEGEIRTPEGDLSWFEKITVLAFAAFRRLGVPLAVLEVGLGGRLDATNAADPLVSAIVSIGEDHTRLLGRSLFDIAKEKAGVMREGKPVVLGNIRGDVLEFLQQAAYLQAAMPVVARRLPGTPENFSYGPYGGMKLGLKGGHQLQNAGVAIELLEILATHGFTVSEGALRKGLAEVRHPGRLELFAGSPPILLDGAHNPPAFAALAAYLREEGPKAGVTVLIGMMADKDRLQAWNLLKTLNPRFVFTEVPVLRSVKKEDWEAWSRSLGLQAPCFAEPLEAFQEARRLTPPDGMVVITGSLYLVGALRTILAGFHGSKGL